MTTPPLKFRNILGELTIAKLYGGEHLGVTAPTNFDLRAEISKIGKALNKFYEPSVTQTKVIQIPPQLQKVLPNAFWAYEGIYHRYDCQMKQVSSR